MPFLENGAEMRQIILGQLKITLSSIKILLVYRAKSIALALGKETIYSNFQFPFKPFSYQGYFII